MYVFREIPRHTVHSANLNGVGLELVARGLIHTYLGPVPSGLWINDDGRYSFTTEHDDYFFPVGDAGLLDKLLTGHFHGGDLMFDIPAPASLPTDGRVTPRMLALGQLNLSIRDKVNCPVFVTAKREMGPIRIEIGHQVSGPIGHVINTRINPRHERALDAILTKINVSEYYKSGAYAATQGGPQTLVIG